MILIILLMIKMRISACESGGSAAWGENPFNNGVDYQVLSDLHPTYYVHRGRLEVLTVRSWARNTRT